MNGADTTVYLMLDQGLPRDAAVILREAGWNCDHASELGMSRAEDTDILMLARDHEAVIVTLDADFHAILATSGASRPSVIRIRLQGLDGKDIAGYITKVVRRFAHELRAGCLVTVKAKKTTCHMLSGASAE